MSSNCKSEDANEVIKSNEHPSLPVVSDNLLIKTPPSKSFLGKAITIKGDIAAKEDMIINGQIKGKIVVKNHAVVLGKDSTIDANVVAKIVVINGQLIGDVYASEQATIGSTGRVLGNIYAPDVSIEDGALLKGNVDMAKQDISKFDAAEPPQEKPVKKTAIGKLFHMIRSFTQRNGSNNVTVKKALELLPTPKNNNAENDLNPLVISTIGESVVIRGDITTDEDVCMHGEFDGVIYSKNNKLVVGDNAVIKANIYVQSFISSGEIKGDIFAGTQILIKSPGHVTGNLHSPRVGIESGAALLGKIEMEKQNIENMFSNLTSGYKKHDHAFMAERIQEIKPRPEARSRQQEAKPSEKKARRSPRAVTAAELALHEQA